MPPDRQDRKPGGLRSGDGPFRPRVVREDDGRRAFRQQRVEQPHLGAMIVLDGRMIIHVVAAEIGETAGRQPHPVEPPLVETVARRLHRGMGDAGLGQFGEQPVQRDRIRRGERAVFVAARRDDARRPDRCRRKSRLLPDLARERGDRGLAAGAGDGHHRLGLATEEARGAQRQCQARVFHLEARN